MTKPIPMPTDEEILRQTIARLERGLAEQKQISDGHMKAWLNRGREYEKAIMRAEAAEAHNAALREALERCSAPFKLAESASGVINETSKESIAREFATRMAIAADALSPDAGRKMLDRVEALEEKLAQAYQVIGVLCDKDIAVSEAEQLRALDYFHSDTFDKNFLPFGVDKK